MSIKTIRSHRSNASIVEPINRTCLSALAPHLSTRDLGPPITTMSLNMNFAFPPATATAVPGLRATQSFFSDESSAIQNPRSSFRRRFNLPSLRNALPSSPRAHHELNPSRMSLARTAKLHNPCCITHVRCKCGSRRRRWVRSVISMEQLACPNLHIAEERRSKGLKASGEEISRESFV